ncbi:hypothetical protein CCACVL1_29070 [Corchorus capsularis]|uniref:Uncharacterized protein n=1 Tax=Corchorus capsularis TaxID=210143 RepID=A0A1R3G413_COCAP|nr:hypothetical protein CCACVL1_29070 [Corchorus capsularis]
MAHLDQKYTWPGYQMQPPLPVMPTNDAAVIPPLIAIQSRREGSREEDAKWVPSHCKQQQPVMSTNGGRF